MDIAERLERTFVKHRDRPALAIRGTSYTYAQLAERVMAIQAALVASTQPSERLVGVITTDTLDTYASVLAVLRSGRAFVPLNPEHPAGRNSRVLQQADLRTVLSPPGDSSLGWTPSSTRIILTAERSTVGSPGLVPASPNDLAYLLFTSGSTGEPKGVPITRGNLSAFLDALAAAGCSMGDGDRVLQMFDLTFDFSIASYLAPLSSGACVFTVPPGTIKFAEVYRLLEEERLTVAPMVPSMLTYLRPYFGDIHLPALRLAFFCGEALHADVVTEWLACAPNATIVNFYGPTEATVFAMAYTWKPADGLNKALNGVVSIGRAMTGMHVLIVDEDANPVVQGQKGGLALAGPQLTPGFWNDPERNRDAFFEVPDGDERRRYYRTGDLAVEDADGDFLFCGRLDHQVKLQGYRVELGEIEHHVRTLLPAHACVVLPRTTSSGTTELYLVVEGYGGDLKDILGSLRERVPFYMVPSRAVSLDHMPLNANGKIDRRRLLAELEADHG
jgi:amino acid adenylation domain-containing protein